MLAITIAHSGYAQYEQKLYSANELAEFLTNPKKFEEIEEGSHWFKYKDELMDSLQFKWYGSDDQSVVFITGSRPGSTQLMVVIQIFRFYDEESEARYEDELPYRRSLPLKEHWKLFSERQNNHKTARSLGYRKGNLVYVATEYESYLRESACRGTDLELVQFYMR